MPTDIVVSSEGRSTEVLVQSEDIELGSILRIGDCYGIVAGMRYSEDDRVGSKQKLIAEVDVFGRLVDGKLKRVKRPVKPYIEVELAGKQELEDLLSCSEKISLGNVYGTLARAFMNAREYDRHTAILASTGAGKSYTAANLIKEYVNLGLPVLVVDTHGEYPLLLGKLAEENNFDIEVYTISKTRQGLPEFKIPVSGLNPTDFNHFIPLTEAQESALGMLIENIGEPEYTLREMVLECGNLNTSVIHEGTIQALKRKLSTLERIFRTVFDKVGTDVSRLITPGKVTIIDTSLASQGVKRAVVSYLSKELLEGRVNKELDVGDYKIEYPLLLVVEEAHNYAGSDLTHSCKRQLQRIASEGRKFGLGLCVISQKPSKIDEEILSQCNTGVYMHITNPRDKEHIRRSFECINDAIVRDLDSLDVGECIIAGAMLEIPFLMCTVDRINVKDESKPKFRFLKPEKIRVGGFEYK